MPLGRALIENSNSFGSLTAATKSNGTVWPEIIRIDLDAAERASRAALVG